MTLDFDGWRASYDTATVADQRRFHSEVYAAYPCQQHFSAEPLAACIEEYHPRRVVELGGWDGEAAVTMLDRFDFIQRWDNVEICQEAMLYGHEHERYHAWHLSRWFWEHDWECDLFVASHTIEHLRAHDLDATLGAVTADVLYLDSPLMDQALNWAGSPTTHILEIGWNGVHTLCAQHGYECVSQREVKLPPSSGDRTRVCIYRKEDRDG